MLGNTGVRKIIISFLICFGVVSSLSVQLSFGQSFEKRKYSSGQITPLNVGDKCPDFLFKTIINGSNTSGRLSDYQGKLVILDFWSTYCSTCISDFPKKQNLQDKFDDSIQILLVADQKSAWSIVPAFWRKNLITKKLTLPCAIDSGQILQKYFPRETLGLQVWIDGDGIVRGITTPEYVNETNIRRIIKGEKVTMPVYRFIDDKNLPLLRVNEITNPKPTLKYYSSLFNYLPSLGRDESGSSRIDSAEGTKTIRDVNVGIKVLYESTLIYNPLFSKKMQVIWQVKDSSRYFYKSSLGYEFDWRLRNAYCYEAKIPLEMSDSVFLEYKRQDFNKYFGLRCFEKRLLTKCFVLRSLRNDNTAEVPIVSKGAVVDDGQNQINDELTGTYNSIDELLNGISLSTQKIITSDLDPHKEIEVILILKYALRSNQPKVVSTIQEFNLQLYNYGFVLEPVERQIDFLYITEISSK